MTKFNLGTLFLSALMAVFCAGATPAVLAQEKAEVFEPVLAEDLSLSLKGVSPYAAAPDAAAPASEASAAAPAGKAPPIPIHSIEGLSGTPIVPMAYFVNAGPEGTVFGLPSASYSYLMGNDKMVHAFAVSETIYRRIEVSYAFNRVSLGDFPSKVRNATGINIGRNHVALHHINLRGLLVEEDSHDLPLPAVAAGVHFKINEGMRSIDHRLGGAINGLGFERESGVDYTLTSTKTIPKIAFGRPVIATVGLRFSQAAQIGWLGFGDAYRLTWETGFACPVLDNLIVAYEYRQKKNPYSRLGNLVGKEEGWHTVSLVWIADEHLTVAGLWGDLGNLIDDDQDAVWGLQIKYEF